MPSSTPVWRGLDAAEERFLKDRYEGLPPDRFAELTTRLSRMRTGEMEPLYILRYGFYEGHTGWRTDPVAIAFIFGLRTLEEIEAAFPGALYRELVPATR